MATLSSWLAPGVLAAGLGFGAAIPVPAVAEDDLLHVLVHVADVIVHGGHHYYRYGGYGYGDRLVVRYDPYGHAVYYRTVPRYQGGYYYGGYYGYRGGPHVYYHGDAVPRSAKCNKHGKCKVTYYDRGGYYDDRVVYDRYYSTHDYRSRRVGDVRYWDGRRWRYRDDD
jgi:hypothetical protein